MRHGPELLAGGGVRFRLWAPGAASVRVRVRDERGQRMLLLDALDDSWFSIDDPRARPASRYAFLIDADDRPVPDPASRFQPDGVHEESEVVDVRVLERARTPWRKPAWHEQVFYELHIGTFTPEGTYRSAMDRLDHLDQLGINAIELMPVAETPGAYNWGYDGVFPFAPAHRYGRPDDLVAFIEAAHRRGIAVYLDVVYNHFGPEGNYVGRYAPAFFTDRYRTPWGSAIDFESPGNEPVGAFFTENATYWTATIGFDGLRLDATHAIYDSRSPDFLERFVRELASRDAAPALIIENERNDARLLRAGFNAQWNDDLHHALHVLVTGENASYYEDFADRPTWYLGRALTQGFAYQGEPSRHKGGEPRGASARDLPLTTFVGFLQNHDQIGNRALGDRITMLAPSEAVRAALAILLLAPAPPLLFMGEEWAASTPFLFFSDFEPELGALVAAGRRSEFAAFPAFHEAEQQAAIPDPRARETFARSVLNWDERTQEPHARWLAFYRAILRIRRNAVVPHIEEISATGFDLIGERGLRATWQLRAGEMLICDANLDAHPCAGFVEEPTGAIIFGTHGARYRAGIAPAWSVRWTLV